MQRQRNRLHREKAELLLEQLRCSLEQAEGLDAAFQRHMPGPHGKYLVFCSTAEHMQEMISYVGEWLGWTDPDPRIYRVSFPGPKTLHELDAFREDNSDHLSLLFSIDMLNEGIHVADLDGVILFRPTVSPILYKQQIGRALSAGSGKTPVVFDVVNNIENLYAIGAVDEEFEEAVSFWSAIFGEGTGDRIRERFQIIDELRDCGALFEQLNDTLTASCDDMF